MTTPIRQTSHKDSSGLVGDLGQFSHKISAVTNLNYNKVLVLRWKEMFSLSETRVDDMTLAETGLHQLHVDGTTLAEIRPHHTRRHNQASPEQTRLHCMNLQCS